MKVWDSSGHIRSEAQTQANTRPTPAACAPPGPGPPGAYGRWGRWDGPSAPRPAGHGILASGSEPGFHAQLAGHRIEVLATQPTRHHVGLAPDRSAELLVRGLLFSHHRHPGPPPAPSSRRLSGVQRNRVRWMPIQSRLSSTRFSYHLHPCSRYRHHSDRPHGQSRRRHQHE